MTRLFVYGTLRARHAAHGFIEPHLIEIEPATTRGALYALPEGYPAFLDGDGEVTGDLAAIPDDLLSRLDAYEGCYGERDPRNHYDRRSVEALAASGNTVEAWIYVYCDARRAELTGKRIPSGDWAAYLRESGRREFGR